MALSQVSRLIDAGVEIYVTNQSIFSIDEKLPDDSGQPAVGHGCCEGIVWSGILRSAAASLAMDHLFKRLTVRTSC